MEQLLMRVRARVCLYANAVIARRNRVLLERNYTLFVFLGYDSSQRGKTEGPVATSASLTYD